MIIHFIRHAQAIKRSPTMPDEQRYLSCRGRKRFRKVSAVLRHLDIDPYYIFTSPRVRAVQTADILAEKLQFNGEIIITPLLSDCTLQSFHELLLQYPFPKECVLVGHDPDFSEIIAHLLHLPDCSLAKGSVVTLKVSCSPSTTSAVITSMITHGGEFISQKSKAVSLLQRDQQKRSKGEK